MNHKTWTTFFAYFRNIPIDKGLTDQIRKLFDNGDNVLLMIKKENPKTNPKFTPEEKFKELCTIFDAEMKANKLIISKVPDTSSIINRRF